MPTAFLVNVFLRLLFDEQLWKHCVYAGPYECFVQSAGFSYNSYWVALFWVVVGKMLAERSQDKALSAKTLSLLGLVGIISL